MKKFSLFIVTTLMIYPDLVSGLAAQTSDEHIYVGEKVCRQCHNLPGSRDQYDNVTSGDDIMITFFEITAATEVNNTDRNLNIIPSDLRKATKDRFLLSFSKFRK